tara:strand:- start:740 stop:1000 length:261 start_codon:yes stop_codon:yes gene_type:complete
MFSFIKRWWKWFSAGALVLFGLFVYLITRKKKKPEPKDPVVEMHNEAVDIIIEISEKEYNEIEEALKSENPAADIADRINSGGGPL